MFLNASDGTVVAQVLAGRHDRFNVLVERYLSAVYAVAYAQVGNHADAEDVAQEAFLQAYQRLDTLRERKKFEGWVTTIARNLGTSLARRRKREADARKQAADAGEQSAKPVIPDELEQMLARQVDALQPGLRETLMLHYFAGKKSREIARLLDISEDAVRKRLQRGREALGQQMLTALAEEKASPETQRKLNRRIVGLLGGVSAAWITQIETAAAVSGSAFGVGKLAVAAMFLVAVGAALWTLRGDDVPATTSADTRVTEAAPVDRAATTAAPAGGTEEAAPEIRIPVRHEDVDLVYTSPEGIWHALDVVYQYDRNTGTVSKETTFSEGRIQNAGDSFLLAVHELDVWIARESPTGLFGVHLHDLRADIEFGAAFTGLGVVTAETAGMQPLPKFRGTFNAEFTRYQGEIRRPDGVVSATLRLERLTPAELELREAALLAKRETEQAIAALTRWQQRNKRWPGEDEARRIVRSKFTDQAVERLVTYRLPQDDSFEENPYDWDHRRNPGRAIYRPDLPVADRLMRYEAYLTNLWGDAFANTDSILTIEYPQYEITAHAGAALQVRLAGYAERAMRWAPEFAEHENDVLRDECMENLKQLGLVIRMFLNEAPEGICPPGWRTMYPEYLPNRLLLRCPSREPGTLSYEIVYPASNEAYWSAVHEELTGQAPTGPRLSAAAATKIPVIIETHDCASIGGEPRRCVAYADGHVEALTLLEFKEQVGPYLDYR